MGRTVALIRGCYRGKWTLLRAALAALLLAVLMADNPGRLARLEYARLPGMDYLAQARELRASGYYGEALIMLDAGLGDEAAADREALHAEREAVIAERDSLFRRARAFGQGAISGYGESIESLAGAIAADFFIVGDVRDLAIQSGRLALDGEADPLIFSLSALGVITTLRPDLDWLPAFIKSAHKTGALTARMTRSLAELCRQAVKTHRFEALAEFAGGLRTLMKHTSPGGAARLLRRIDTPAELERVASFVRRHPDGAFALHATGDTGVDLVRGGARQADEALLLAARKGRHGEAWLRSGRHHLLRPHPLIGLTKGLYKGNVQKAVVTLSDRYLDPYGWLLIPAAAAWLVLELSLVIRRLRRLMAKSATPVADQPEGLQRAA
jgi:hypothetical protein